MVDLEVPRVGQSEQKLLRCRRHVRLVEFAGLAIEPRKALDVVDLREGDRRRGARTGGDRLAGGVDAHGKRVRRFVAHDQRLPVEQRGVGAGQRGECNDISTGEAVRR